MTGRARRARELRRLGAAVILNWNTIPMKLERALFEDASSMPVDQKPSRSRSRSRGSGTITRNDVYLRVDTGKSRRDTSRGRESRAPSPYAGGANLIVCVALRD